MDGKLKNRVVKYQGR